MTDGIWLPLPVDFAEHPDMAKVARYGSEACAIRDLYVQLMCYCKRHLSDGYVPIEQVGKLVYPDPPEAGTRRADKLVLIGVVLSTPDAYFLPRFLETNHTKAEVKELSAVRAKAGAAGGRRSGEVRRARSNEAKLKQSESKPEPDTDTEADTELQKQKRRLERTGSELAGTSEPGLTGLNGHGGQS